MTSEEELWEAYTAGAENGYQHADQGYALTFDALREDFGAWLEQWDG